MNKYVKSQISIFWHMLLVSLIASCLSPLNKSFQDIYGLSVASASIFSVLITTGSFVGNSASAFVFSHLGNRKFKYLSHIVYLVTILITVTANSLMQLYIAVFFFGLTCAVGFVSSSTDLSHLPEKYRNFGLYHSFFGMGTIITPAIIGLLIKQNISHVYFFSALGILIIITFIKDFIIKDEEHDNDEKTSLSDSVKILKNRFILLAFVILILYCGCEMGIMLWSSNLFVDVFESTKAQSAFNLSLFGIVFTFTRMINAYLEKLFNYKTLIILSVVITVSAIVWLLLTGSVIAFALIAMGFAPIFPSTQKYALNHIKKREYGMFNGLLFAIVTVGNITISPTMGIIGGFSMIYSFIIAAVCFSAIIAFVLMLPADKKIHVQ